MFKLFFLTFFVASLALSLGEELQISEADVLIPAEELPPKTLVRFRRQLFGGFGSRPFGGFDGNIGYKGSLFSSPTRDATAWGTISSSSIPNKYGSLSTGPAIFSGGADLSTNTGSGFGSSFKFTEKLGGSGSLTGNYNLLNNPSHKWDVFGSHTQKFNDKFSKVGPGSTTFGTKYQNANGFESVFSKTQTPGHPNVFEYGAGKTFENKAQIDLSGKTAEKIGSELTLSGKLPITDNIHVFGSHTKGLDTKFNVLGSSSTLGAGYNSESGAEITGSITRTSGQPDKGTIKTDIPVWTTKEDNPNGNAKFSIGSESNFQQGSKPDHKIVASISTDF